MWLPWRRKSASRVGGVVGRHRAAGPGDRASAVTTPTAYVPQVSLLLAASVAAPPLAPTPLALPSTALPVLPVEPLHPGTVGLVFRDGSQYLIAPEDLRGQTLRDLAGQMTTRRLAHR